MMYIILIIFTVSLGFGLCCFVLILDSSLDLSEKIFKIGTMSLTISVFTAFLGMLVSLMEAF